MYVKPSWQRRRRLGTLSRYNEDRGRPPFKDVEIRYREELEWILREHGSFAGYTSESTPRTPASVADLRGVVLRDIDASFLNLNGAILRGADLSYTNLASTSLIGADLRGADLEGSDLTETHLIPDARIQEMQRQMSGLKNTETASRATPSERHVAIFTRNELLWLQREVGAIGAESRSQQPRACYELNINGTTRCSKRQANAMKCSPASTEGRRS